ncbi:MAG TPA: DUF420 domain-containing protein [Gammaproteobacteria bacterium]|nr:DUF420 domain-containing protein [Gammaproteobacteria bacterium]
MNLVSYIPHTQALLNLATVLLLVSGYLFIRRGDRRKHRNCMLSAALVSVLFMVCYLFYHTAVGNVPFAGEGAIRPVYFAILASHVTLAAVNLPLVVVVLYYAMRGRFDGHRRFARRSLPVWIYVSVTGLLIYGMAFHIYA